MDITDEVIKVHSKSKYLGRKLYTFDIFPDNFKKANIFSDAYIISVVLN